MLSGAARFLVEWAAGEVPAWAVRELLPTVRPIR
jgi:hypothetical protein